MKNRLLLTLFLAGILLAANSCESDDPSPEKKSNPFEMEVGWNGFVVDETEFETPNAIIEFYGENLDSLTSNFDVSFTDGTFDPEYRVIDNHSILVFFDVNSPSLESLSSGIYYFEDTPDREPNIINKAYIQISTETTIIKYPVITGTVEVKSIDGYILIEYLLIVAKDGKTDVEVVGQYTGAFQIIDQQFKN